MPAIPSSTEIVRDFGLGLTQPASMVAVVFGVASDGAQNALAFVNDPDSVRTTYGEGPAVETACNILAQGGGPIGFIRANPSIAASNGSVTKVGSSPNVTLSGSATIDAHLYAEIVAGGALGVGTFRYSVDAYAGDTAGERTYSETLLIPSGGTFAIPGLGITLTFAAGTYIAGDNYTVDVQCAAANASDLAAGMAVLAANKNSWRFFVLVTSQANGGSSAHATLAAALQSQLTTLASASKYRRGMMPAESGGDAGSTVATSFNSTVASRLLIAFGAVRRTTVKPFAGYAFPKTHGIDVFAARAAASLPSTDLKRKRSGPCTEVVKLFNDEFLNPTGLDDYKISTLRTYENEDGFFITQARLKSPNGSDFKLWPHGILMDIACETTNAILSNSIGRDLRIAQDGSGAIDSRDAANIEAEVNSALASALLTPLNAEGVAGYVTDVRFTLDMTHNFLSDGVVIGEVGILPRGYADYIRTTLGYVSSLPAAAAA